MHIVVVGLSHRTAPVEVREKLSIPDQSITESLKALKALSDVLEVSILARSIIGLSEAVLVKIREDIDIFLSNSFNPLQTISKSGKS